MSSKNHLLASEIIAKYHSRYRKNKELRENLLKNPDDYKLTYLVEKAMAQVGGHKFVDGHHYDLDDGSEIKTASIRVNGASGSTNSFVGEITGVTSANGTHKTGSIRLVIYNPHTQSLMYYFLPKTCWEKHVTRHPTSGVGKVVYSYNKRTDEIAKFEPYRVKSFRQLALKKA
jgi:hypothetical protein